MTDPDFRKVVRGGAIAMLGVMLGAMLLAVPAGAASPPSAGVVVPDTKSTTPAGGRNPSPPAAREARAKGGSPYLCTPSGFGRTATCRLRNR